MKAQDFDMDYCDRNGFSSTSSEKNDPHQKTKEKKKKLQPVSFFSLFRFATVLDRVLTMIGLVAAIGNGAVGPLMMYFFAAIIETFSRKSTNFCRVNYTALSSEFCQSGIVLTANNFLEQSSKCNLSWPMNNTVSSPRFQQQLHQQALHLIVIGCISFTLAYVQTIFCSLGCERQTRRIRELVFGALVRKQISYFDTHTTGELVTILNNSVDRIHDGIGDKLGLLVQLVAKFLISLIIAFIRGWKMTLVVLSLAPLIWIVSIISSKMSEKIFARELAAYERAGTIAEEVFSNIRTVLAFNGADYEQSRYEENIESARKQGIKKGAIVGIIVGSMYFILFGSHALAFWYGNHLIHHEDYDIANVIFVFFNVIVALYSLGQSASYRESINQAKVAAASVWEILQPNEEQGCTTERKIPGKNFRGKVKFDAVYFSYPSRSEVSVLRGLTFEVASGQTIAIVGASGCGKSTCMQLLQQFYKPTEGKILLDGQPIERFDSEELRQKIGVVNQDPVLFATTIFKNIQYGQSNVTFADIQAAAIAANAHKFIMSLPDKYETVVGERGTQLSGGERQRIVIARALVRRPTLLLLDEASSALDNQSERMVQEALEKAAKDRTTIIIAHRLSTVRRADQIIVIDNGMVVEEGNHETLMKRQSTYYSLVKAQVFQEPLDDNEQQSSELAPMINDSNDSDSDNEISALQIDKQRTQTNSKKKIRWPSLAILKLNRPELVLIITGALASVFNGGLEPVSAIILGEIIGVYQECDIQVQNAKIQLYVILYTVLAVLISVTMFTQSFMFACSGEALTKRLRAKAFHAIIRQEIAWFDQQDNNTGAICTRLSRDAATIQGVAGARIGTILSSFANLGVGIAIAFFFGWKLSLVALGFIPFMVVGSFLQVYFMEGYSSRDNKALERAGSLAFQALQNIRTVRQLTLETRFIDDYIQLLNIPYRSSLRRVHLFALIYSFTISTAFFSMAAVFSYGGLLVERNEMSFKNVMIVVNCMIFGAQSVGNSAAMAPDYGKAVSSARRMLALFSREPKISLDAHGMTLKNYTGDIHVKAVHFAYATRPRVPILNNISLDIKSGQRLAFVGLSGNGKSTLLHLLERFYDVQSGAVLVDSKDLRDVNLKWWRSQVGIVTQEPTLFNVSIAENLAYGDLSRQVSMSEIIEAAKNANIHEFIQQLPQGYETCVGSKGDQLSGGQKQRIAIGRVFIRNPKVILLDEATSALDSESEKLVNEALTRAIIGRTAVVIAHRLSTIQDADVICVLHNGHIIESGTHQQLLAQKGFYHKLSQCTK